MAGTGKVSIGSLKTAKEIVSYLIEANGAGVTETANHIDKPVSTTFEYFDTLTELGYLVQNEDGYHVSTLFLSTGTRVREHDRLYKVAKSQVNAFAEDLDEHVSLIKEENGYAVTLYHIRNDDSIQAEGRPGERNYLHLSAGGKAILAHLPRERVHEIVERDGLEQLTENTISRESELLEELETIRERGYAIAREESIVGINEVSIPIAVESARSVGSVTVFGPASDLTGERLTRELPEKLEQLKNIVESNLTYRHYRGDASGR